MQRDGTPPAVEATQTMSDGVGERAVGSHALGAEGAVHRQATRPVLWRVAHAFAVTATAVVFIAAIGAGIATLHLRANAQGQPQPHPPVAVQTVSVTLQPQYAVQRTFVGRLEPARETSVAFESAGLVTAVLKDEGDRVATGDVIARLGTRKLTAQRDELQAQVRELEARKTLAELTLNRQARLTKRGWTAEQRLDEARATQAEVTAAIERVEARLAAVEIDLAKSEITAPFAGLVSARLVDDGAVVSPGAPVVTILEDARRWARIGLPPRVAAGLRADGLYTVQTPQGLRQARLLTQRPDLETGTRTVTVLFDVQGAEATPFGELVSLVHETRIDDPGAWLPLTALTQGVRGLWSVMTVIDEGGPARVQAESVEVLHVADGRAFVRGTLRDGARVLRNGTHRVVSGQHVALLTDHK